MRIGSIVKCAAIGTALLLSHNAHAQSGGMVITTDGMLGINAGMRYRQVAARFKREGVYGQSYCDVFESRDGLISVMVENGVVTSVGTRSSRLGTPSGARVGMTEAALRGLYGKRLRRGQTESGGADSYYLLLVSSSGNALRFDISDGRVAGIDAGHRSSVEANDGCA